MNDAIHDPKTSCHTCDQIAINLYHIIDKVDKRITWVKNLCLMAFAISVSSIIALGLLCWIMRGKGW